MGALLTREPGGTELGEKLRALLLDPEVGGLDARAETLMLLAARAQHVREVIRPTLEAGRSVVCDRYSGSTIAYQGYGRGLDPKEIKRMSLWASGGLEPDVVILLELKASLVPARLGPHRATDRIEAAGEEFFARVSAGFARLAAEDRSRWRVVDASGSVEEVAARVRLAAGLD